MGKNIQAIDSNALFDDIHRFLELKGVEASDYRLVEVDSFEEEDKEMVLYQENDKFIVPADIAEEVAHVGYLNYHRDVYFADKEGKTLLKSGNFFDGNWSAIHAFSFDHLNFHLEDIFE